MSNGRRAMDEETIKWLRDEALEDGDTAIARACTAALGGDFVALATVEETLRNRVARAHQSHRERGQASRLDVSLSG